jgi:GMP synthase (glutamine-hydrolysing)
MLHEENILVLDFGSQYTQLIARRIRELGVYSEIKPYDCTVEQIRQINPKGIVFSGGPSSVYEQNAPLPDARILDINVPVLGICYGLQVLAHILDGEVAKAQKREYGRAHIQVDENSLLFDNLSEELTVWMSHGDRLTKLPEGFQVIGHTANAPIAAIRHRIQPLYGIQFHPEVAHTPKGKDILANFVFRICGCSDTWTPRSFIDACVQQICERVNSRRVLCALSGGVDSAVAASLVARAIGHQLVCVFVDTGMLRAGEPEEVCNFFKNADFEFRFIDASALFLEKLRGVTDPEKKRKIIGNQFIRIFEAESERIGNITFLVQGTLYPDVIESTSTRGPSATIKTHHNVGGLPEKMNLDLIEPLRELFKDEVRRVGQELGVPEQILKRHPFPGPGLAVRVLGAINKERLDTLRAADAIYIDELRKQDLYDEIWQAFAVLLLVQTVGVMGDERTYDNVIALRAVTSMDGMTADWARIPPDVLGKISNRIINEVAGVNRIVYDISSKPPSTIEWE